LKSNIVPLQRTLRDVILPRGEKKAPAAMDLPATAAQSAGGKSAAGGDGALWLLRQLRPVSYSFRKGVDSKFMRFGFIADELESVVPEVVRRPGDREVTDQKAVVYQDLIALLASASQSQQGLIESQQSRIESQQSRIESLEMKMDLLLDNKDETKKGRRGLRKKKKTKVVESNVTNATNVSNTTNSTLPAI
jgi:hypothetical protein